MDTREKVVVHAHIIKPDIKKDAIEIPVSRNSKVLGVTADPRHHWPVIAIQEPEKPDTDTMVRTFYLRPDGTPFDSSNRLTHIGSVHVQMFNANVELVHVFEERVPQRNPAQKEIPFEPTGEQLMNEAIAEKLTPPTSHKVNG